MSDHASSTASVSAATRYYVPHESHYPIVLAGALFLLALGFVLQINGFRAGPWSMVAGAGIIAYVLFGWFGTVIDESQRGRFGSWEDRSFRFGMIWFIASEVAFFAAFFGALFYLRVISVPALAGMEDVHGLTLWPGFTGEWPTSGPAGPAFTPMAPWGIPALNTALLLSSGATITWAHWALLRDRRTQLNLGLALTVLLGAIFLGFQVYEYRHAYADLGLTLDAGAYGATFFMLTGFHGFHVTLGLIMLVVVLLRCLRRHFRSDSHFAFEAVAWYWHFVDVVWLVLFVFVYWL
jgi:cytochrome c oxidase subunit 3